MILSELFMYIALRIIVISNIFRPPPYPPLPLPHLLKPRANIFFSFPVTWTSNYLPSHRRTHLPHPPLPSHLSSEIGGNCFELQDRWITERCLWWTTPECRHQHRFDLLIPLVFLRLRASTARPTPFYPFPPPRARCHFIFCLLNSLYIFIRTR